MTKAELVAILASLPDNAEVFVNAFPATNNPEALRETFADHADETIAKVERVETFAPLYPAPGEADRTGFAIIVTRLDYNEVMA